MKHLQHFSLCFLFCSCFLLSFSLYAGEKQDNKASNTSSHIETKQKIGNSEEFVQNELHHSPAFSPTPFKFYEQNKNKRTEAFWTSKWNTKVLDSDDISFIFSTETYSHLPEQPLLYGEKYSYSFSQEEKKKEGVQKDTGIDGQNREEKENDIETIYKKNGLSQRTINEICAMPMVTEEVTEKLKDAVFVCPARPYDYTKTASLYNSSLLSKEEKEKIIDTDQSKKFKKFFEKRADVCIPTYTKSTLWEKNKRYRKTDSGCGIVIYRSVVRKGDTIQTILSDWVDKKEAQLLIKAALSVYSLNKLILGNIFAVEIGEKDSLQSFSYDIDEGHRLIVERFDEGFSAKIYEQDIEVKLNLVQGTIKDSLFEAIAETGESAVLGARLRDIFIHQLNFIDDVENADFKFLVEKKYINGIFKRYGEIIGAIITDSDKTYEAYLYGKERKEYYNEKGEVLSSEFLTTPVTNAIITSQYSSARVHPYKGVKRPHLGVDYNAPIGSPIKAIGNGVVTDLGWKNGFGNTIIISHGNNLETHYSHLARFQEGLKENDIVSKGQIIGFVGRTGITTAPHVDFRTVKKGKFINPKEITTTVPQTIPEREKRAFYTEVENIRAFLNGKELSEYKSK